MEQPRFQEFKQFMLNNSRIRSQRVIKAARHVLVDNETKADAARKAGITPQAVGKAFSRINLLLKKFEKVGSA